MAFCYHIAGVTCPNCDTSKDWSGWREQLAGPNPNQIDLTARLHPVDERKYKGKRRWPAKRDTGG